MRVGLTHWSYPCVFITACTRKAMSHFLLIVFFVELKGELEIKERFTEVQKKVLISEYGLSSFTIHFA